MKPIVLGMKAIVLMGCFTSEAWGLPRSIRQEVVRSKYHYTSSLSRGEVYVDDVIGVSGRVQKAGYNVSGKPVLIRLEKGFFGKKGTFSFEGVTDAAGTVKTDFHVGKAEGSFEVKVFFLHSKHRYVEHVSVLEYRVISKGKFYVYGILLGGLMLGLLIWGWVFRKEYPLNALFVNPCLVRQDVMLSQGSYGGRYGIVLLTLGLWTVAFGMIAYYLGTYDGLFMVLCVMGVCGVFQKEGLRGLLFYDGLWVVLGSVWLRAYGGSDLFELIFMNGFGLGLVILGIVVCPSPVLWVGLLVLLHCLGGLSLGWMGVLLFLSLGWFMGTYVLADRIKDEIKRMLRRLRYGG